MSQLKSNLKLTSLVLRGAYYSAYKLRAGVKLSPALLIEEMAARTPQAPALHFEGRSQDYAEFNARANRVGNAFASLGAKKGDAVALFFFPPPRAVSSLAVTFSPLSRRFAALSRAAASEALCFSELVLARFLLFC